MILWFTISKNGSDAITFQTSKNILKAKNNKLNMVKSNKELDSM